MHAYMQVRIRIMSQLRRCMHSGIIHGMPYCTLESEQEWNGRAAAALRRLPAMVEAVLLDPFSKEAKDVRLALTTSTTPGLFGNRIVSAADRDASALLGIDEGLLRGVPLLEDLSNGDYVMCLCMGLGEGALSSKENADRVCVALADVAASKQGRPQARVVDLDQVRRRQAVGREPCEQLVLHCVRGHVRRVIRGLHTR